MGFSRLPFARDRSIKTKLTLLFLILFFAMKPQRVLAEDTLILTTFPDSDTPNIIIAHAIMKEAYKRLGINIELRYLPGRRAISSANSGTMDGLLFHVPDLNLTYTDLIQIKTPVFHSEIVAFVQNKNFEIDSWDTARKHLVGFIRGFSLVEERTRGAQIEMFNEQEEMFLMLSKGKIDVAIDTYLTGKFSINKLNLNGISRSTSNLETFSSFHYLHIKHRALATKIEVVLREMEEDGFIKHIRNTTLKGLLEED